MPYYDDEITTIVIDDSFGVLWRCIVELGSEAYDAEYEVPVEVKFAILRDYDLHKIAERVIKDNKTLIYRSGVDVSIADRGFNFNDAENSMFGGIINIMSGDGGVARNLGQRLGNDYLDYIFRIVRREYEEMIKDGVITPDMFTRRR